MHYLYRYICILNVFLIYVYGQLSAIKNVLYIKQNQTTILLHNDPSSIFKLLLLLRSTIYQYVSPYLDHTAAHRLYNISCINEFLVTIMAHTSYGI